MQQPFLTFCFVIQEEGWLQLSTQKVQMYASNNMELTKGVLVPCSQANSIRALGEVNFKVPHIECR